MISVARCKAGFQSFSGWSHSLMPMKAAPGKRALPYIRRECASHVQLDVAVVVMHVQLRHQR
ncbi:hypothetical protein D3871_25155 [Noviherbaspirillum saxi]|uniref:Uncharacterized protein n=1 Tax=Noviherbaspirillum saxi TaxID=2320863 RepID=A0A3A3FF39_9BURK|nr:hypothetical protein D3871_25155 [Noviherbaspirillum saxi]